MLVWGALMFVVCLTDITRNVGPAGRLIVPACWAIPSVLAVVCRRWLLSQPLSQHWLIGLQVWRVIGGVFLIECFRDNIPGIFAWPAGVGDILVAVLAFSILVQHRRADRIPKRGIRSVFVLGVADFLSAFFFGFTSSAGPQQLFFPEIANNSLLFPIGLIPLFLVPYAILFHTLSVLQYRADSNGNSLAATDISTGSIGSGPQKS